MALCCYRMTVRAALIHKPTRRSRQHPLIRLARRFADIAGDCVARQSDAKLLDEADSGWLGHFEMGGPGHVIELVEVVRHHPKVDQPLEEFGQYGHPIVDSFQENRLAQEFRHELRNSPEKGRRRLKTRILGAITTEKEACPRFASEKRHPLPPCGNRR